VARIDRVLRPGDAVAVPGATRFDLRNEAATPAVALGFALTAALARPGGVLRGLHVPGPTGQTIVWPAGVTVEPLATGSLGSLSSAPISVAVGRVALAPKAGLPLRTAEGIELFAVESGRLRLVAGGPATVFDHGRDRSAFPVNVSDFGGSAGQGVDLTLESSAAAVVDGGVVSLCNPDDVPAEVWVVTLQPAGTVPESLAPRPVAGPAQG
jgi:hypothetical protein